MERNITACSTVSMMPPACKRTKKTLAIQIKSSPNASKCALLAALPFNHKQKAPVIIMGQSVHLHLSMDVGQPFSQSELSAANFPKVPSTTTVNDCTVEYIEATSNDTLQQVICLACAQELFQHEGSQWAIQGLQNSNLLMPTKNHDAHKLTARLLLYNAALDKDGQGYLCRECEHHLEAAKQPPLSLANRLWIGDIPFQLAILTLPEWILIAWYFPAAYIVKMFLKRKGTWFWDKKTIQWFTKQHFYIQAQHQWPWWHGVRWDDATTACYNHWHYICWANWHLRVHSPWFLLCVPTTSVWQPGMAKSKQSFICQHWDFTGEAGPASNWWCPRGTTCGHQDSYWYCIVGIRTCIVHPRRQWWQFRFCACSSSSRFVWCSCKVGYIDNAFT